MNPYTPKVGTHNPRRFLKDHTANPNINSAVFVSSLKYGNAAGLLNNFHLLLDSITYILHSLNLHL